MRALEEDVTAIVAPPTASVPLAPAGARYTKQAVAYRTAAEQGHMEAQYRLGRMCLCGFGAVTDRPAGHLDTFDDYNLPDDMRIAALWYRKAAAQGHTDAQFRLGLMAHYDGRREAAEAWYTRAARQGHSDALQHLGCVQRELTQGRRAEVYGRELEMYEAEREAHSADESDDLAMVERRDSRRERRDASLAANIATRIREPADD